MDFSQADEKFKQLKARYEAGELTEAEFKSQLQELMVQDEDGAWWMIGYETERWYRHDGTDWVQADPPGIPSRSPIPPGPVESPESRHAEDAVSKPAPAAKGQRGDRTLPIVIVGTLLLVASIFIIPRLSGSPATATPAPATEAPAATEPPAATEAPTQAPPTEAPAADPSILFQDDFSDPSSGWSTFSDANKSAEYSGDGQYVMWADNSEFWTHAGNDFIDVSVEVDATRTAGADTNHFGVICRYQDEQNFYYLYVSSNGHVLIGKRVDGNFTLLSGDFYQSSTDAVFAGNETNHLRADCVGSTLTLYANDQQVASVTDTSLSSGDAGLIMGTDGDANTEISFDNFVVRAAESAEQAAPTEVLAAATEAPVASGDILYQDDFSDPASGWKDISSYEYSVQYSYDHQLEIHTIADYTTLKVHPGKDFTDVSIRVKASMTGGLDYTTYGIICRYESDNDYYYFQVSGGGNYLIGKHLGRQNYALTDWAPLPRDKGVRSANNYIIQLRADCQGSTLSFYANNQFLTSVTDTSLTHGDVGFMINPSSATSLYVSFDDLVVYQP